MPLSQSNLLTDWQKFIPLNFISNNLKFYPQIELKDFIYFEASEKVWNLQNPKTHLNQNQKAKELTQNISKEFLSKKKFISLSEKSTMNQIKKYHFLKCKKQMTLQTMLRSLFFFTPPQLLNKLSLKANHTICFLKKFGR